MCRRSTYMGAHSYAHVCRGQIGCRVSPSTALYLWPWDSFKGSSSFWLGWLVSKLSESTWLPLSLYTGVTGMSSHAWLFSQVLDIQTKLLTPAQQSSLTPMLSPNPHFGVFETFFSSPCWSGACFEDQAGLDIMISSDLPSKCWNYTLETQCMLWYTYTHGNIYSRMYFCAHLCPTLECV